MTPRPRTADVVAPGRDARAGPRPLAAPRLVLTPWFSLVHVLGALAVPGPGLSRERRLRCLAGVNQLDFVTAARPFRSGTRWLPRTVLPVGGGSEAVEHPGVFAEHLLGSGASRLDDELGSRGPQGWRYAVPRAEPWLRAYAAVALQLWPLVREEWQQQLPVLEQEVDRLGRAAVLGRLPEQLASLGPDVRVDPASLTVRLDDHETGWAQRRLVLAPTALTTATVLVADGDDDVVVSHSVRARAGRTPVADRADPLVVLLGRPRARLLTAVATPRTMGEVARALRCTASTATHHVTTLEQAGLVVRRRHGKTVLVLLTPRGDALVSLLREQRHRS